MAKASLDVLRAKKRRGERITMLTAYDYPFAKALDDAGIDVILVGDSLAMVVLGHEGTTPVTMEEMLHHAKAARRGVARALLVGDMPFAAMQLEAAGIVAHAKRFLRDAGCDAVKLEWREGIDAVARDLVTEGIPVMGHVGLTPQTAASEGGFGMRGTTADEAVRIVEQAIALEQAGCFAIVLECVPDTVADLITKRLAIPTIGIGSGPACDGQVLVTYDLLGLFDRFTPTFVKRYAELGADIRSAVGAYVADVQGGRFPGAEHTRGMKPGEAEKFRASASRGAR